jgi:SAM-dependent methyltransferase
MTAADNPNYAPIISHYEAALAKHKTGPQAVDWKDGRNAEIRYGVMLDLAGRDRAPASLLDFGCGLGELKFFMDAAGFGHLRYEGLDISKSFAAAARERLPNITIHCLDVLDEQVTIGEFDYVVMNGIFTLRESLSHADMLDYLERLASRMFKITKRALAFNVMSPCVDWKSDTLFHPSFDEVADILERSMSRHFVIRNDYGLHESTYYVYREPKHAFGG